MKQFTEEQIENPAPDSVKSGQSADLTPLPAATEPPEVRAAKELALRYRLPFVNLLPTDGE